jgi:MFS family permease
MAVATTRPRALHLLGRCLTTPAVAAIAFAYFGFAFVLYFFLSWFPSYLVTGLGVSLRDMSGATAVPWAVGFAGLILSGVIVDRMQRTSWGAVRGRKALLSGGLVVAGVAVGAAGLVTTAVAAVALMSIAAFCIYLTGVCYLGLLRELIDRRALGGVGGFIVAGSSLAGIVAPALTGTIVAATGHFTAAFVLVGAVAIAGAVAVNRLVPDRQMEMFREDD